MDRNTVFSNFLWRFFERIGAQGVTFVVSILLARILGPTVYGVVALVTIFMTVLQVFIDSGFGNALIQKKDADDLDFSTVFYFNLFVSICLYGLLFICAPLIANYYNIDELTPIIRVMGLGLLVSGVKNIQQAYVSKNMIFKKFFFATLGGTIGAAIIGITMALLGFGVWALVLQNLFNAVVDTIILWFTVKWRPKLLFSLQRLKGLFSYGWKLLASSLANTIYQDIRQLIIGKLYSTDDLAYYNKGKSFPQMIITNVYTAIDSVVFATMAGIQDNRMRLCSVTKRIICVNSFVILPMLIGMAAIADTMIPVLLGDAWKMSVPFVRIFCLTNIFYPINVNNRNILRAIGRSDLLLRNEILTDIFGIITILVTMNISVLAIGYGVLFNSVFAVIINGWSNKKLIGYSLFAEFRDLLKILILTLTMGAGVYAIHFLHLPNILLLVIQLFVGASIYIFGAWIFKFDELQYSVNLIKELFHKRIRER